MSSMPPLPEPAAPVPRPADTGAGLPLCVDLDGTLLLTDMLEEGLVAAIGALRWRDIARGLAGGRAALKHRIAEIAPFDPVHLPYNEPFLAWLRTQREAGRVLVLTTAADETVARRIADHLGLFDDVLASDGVRNLKGPAKAAALSARFGTGGFTYAGDSGSDLPVWQVAGGAVLVGTAASIAAALPPTCPIERQFPGPQDRPLALLQAMRPHQWVKNLLAFVPIFTAGAVGDLASWRAAGMAFAAFCATASSIYIVNDLLDLQADREHRGKQRRPFARGALRPHQGVALGLVLLALGLTAGHAAGILAIILVYALMSVSYSIRLKELPLVDVFILTFLYTIRMFGGGEASGHRLSPWLLAFSVFFFFSLALIKRAEDLRAHAAAGRRKAARRGYTTADLPILQSFGIGAAFTSSLTLALFVQSDETRIHYASPFLLSGIVPLILFWQCRLWLSLGRGYMHHDPIVYASKDWVSWLVGAAVLILLYAARTFPLFAS
jgi:4-hydroxybenzoate polyprenyltransferase